MYKKNNQAAKMTAIKKIEICDIEMPVPKKGEVLIASEYVGVCGSDVHFFETGKRKGKYFNLPFVLGHEYAGKVVEVGEGVKDICVGDRITVEPQQVCGKCEYCKGGRYNLCADVVFPSVPPYDGMLRRYLTFPEHQCFKLPEQLSSIEGALIEPMAVGFQAAKCGEVEVGKTIAILGMGCIGLTTLTACKARGASKIIAVDLFDNRLNIAEHLGASAIVNATKTDMTQKVIEITDNKGADIVFETAGNKKTAAATGSILKRGGTIVLVGNIEGETPFDFMSLMYNEGQIRTIYRYRNNYKSTINALVSGSTGIKEIVTDIYSFSDTQKAFERNLTDKQNVVKTMIKFN